jgi:hypothetical protein
MMHTTDTLPVPLGTFATTGRPDPATPAKSSATSPGHDGRGRFAKGNKGGPGNPYARQVARLRQAMLDIVKPEDIQAIIVRMILAAQTGDREAAKLVLAYTLGKPMESVDPDTLDLQEWELAQERVAFHPTLTEHLSAMPVPLANTLASTIVASVQEAMTRTVTAKAQEVQEARAAAQQSAQVAAALRPEASAVAPEPTPVANVETARETMPHQASAGNGKPVAPLDGPAALRQLVALLRQVAPQSLAEMVLPGQRDDREGSDRPTASDAGMANLLKDDEPRAGSTDTKRVNSGGAGREGEQCGGRPLTGGDGGE